MSLVKNSGIVIVGALVSNGLAYAFHFFTARMLGPKEYGEFGALIALFLLLIIPLGVLIAAVTKFTANFYRGNDFIKLNSLRRQVTRDVLIYSAVIFILLLLNANYIAIYLKITSRNNILILGVTLSFCALQTVNNGIVLGLKKYKIYSLSTVLESASRLILLMILLYFGFGYNSGLVAYGFGYLLSAVFIIPYIKETYQKVILPQKISMKPLYKYFFKIMTVSLIFQSLLNLPSLFIKHYYSSEVTGYWTAALNISKISLFVSSAIGQVMFSEIINEKEIVKMKSIFNKSALLMLFISTIIAFLFLFFAQFIVTFLYGSSYYYAIKFLQSMGFVMIGIGILQLWATYKLGKIKNIL